MDRTAAELGQYFTPAWAASELVERFFGDLTASDRVVEPSCGPGAFLQAVPGYVPAVGVEIDPRLAEIARRNTGRQVIVGDFARAELPFTPTCMVGNPPFAKATVLQFLDRALELLPEEGRVGLILPCSIFQTASTVEQLSQQGWSLQADFIPRNLFPRLSLPLCFARLTKERRRGLFNIALYHDTAQVQRLQARYKALLATGEGSVWAAVVQAALESLGGVASLQQLYAEIGQSRPTPNQFWQAKVRQTVQRFGVQLERGVWALKPDLFMRAAA